jgi:hypothetical protein
MAGLLDLFGQRDPNDPVNMGLLGMSAALGTPVRQGGGVGPAFGAFGQGYQGSQQAEMRRRYMEAQIDEMKRPDPAKSPIVSLGGGAYFDLTKNQVVYPPKEPKEATKPPEVVLAEAAFPNDPVKQRQAIEAVLKRKGEHAPQSTSVMPVILGDNVYGLTNRGPGAGSLTPPLGPAPTKPPSDRANSIPPSLQSKLVELEEANNSSFSAINALSEAEGLNDKAYSGYFASSRATARSNLPGKSSPEADATVNYENIINTQALSSLKSLFGGQPTEGERKVLLDLQASVSKTPAQRKEIITRAKRLATERIAANKKLAEGIRAGKFSMKDGGTEQPAAEDPLGIR